jgi:mannose-1-phosphate guanylyltransferase
MRELCCTTFASDRPPCPARRDDTSPAIHEAPSDEIPVHWAVILAGGAGTRFWPLSTPNRPKQLLPLAGDGDSPAHAALRRLEGLVPPERTLVVTGPALARPLQSALALPRENFLIEPRAASTAPALAWASHEAQRRDPDAMLLSLHADWHVPDTEAFQRSARAALAAAAATRGLVTVGIVPTRPETGYGYLVQGETGPGGIRRVSRFTEKPDRAAAESLVAAGALWNSGLFAWRCDALRDALHRHSPEIAPYLGLLDAGEVARFFEQVTPVSIDVGVLERSESVYVVPGEFTWDDIGTWDALRRVRPADGRGNVTVGPTALVESEGCVVWSDGTPVVTSGVKNLVIVAANGRVLVLDRARAADLKHTLDLLPDEIRELPS